jgi:hypothetical protein
MDWIIDQTWTSNVSAEITYTIQVLLDGKYNTSVLQRIGAKVNYILLGSFDTIEEAKASCETDFAGR